MRLALFQPDIPQNLGAAIRLCACLGVSLDVIAPCAFPIDDRRLRRAALDYGALTRVQLHEDWTAFETSLGAGARLVLMSTKGSSVLHSFEFLSGDVLVMGRESAGVPDWLERSIALRVRIPIIAKARSLNVITAATLALGEALRQNDAFPESGESLS